MTSISPIPLAQLTTLRTGAAPARMAEARDEETLVATLRAAWDAGDPWLLLGGGSNLLAGDVPFDGIVILGRTSGIVERDDPALGKARIRVAAGQNWDDLVRYTVARGLSGIEAMSGIPGTAGAAPIQNVGAYGQEIVDTLVDVDLLDESTGDVTTVPAAELGLGPRTSVLKHHGGFPPERSAVVVALTLDLDRVGTGAVEVTSARIRAALGLADGTRISLTEVRERVLAIRRSKGMVLDDADPDTHSAGSFFQNPILPAAAARGLPDGCPRWPMGTDAQTDLIVPLPQFTGYVPPLASFDPDVKASAAWLIEYAGVRKGFHLPRSRAAVSTKHALALTNRGGATGEEVAELARYIHLRVLAETGVALAPEPVFFGVEL